MPRSVETDVFSQHRFDLIFIWMQIDCSGMRGRKHTEESWKCDGENEVDICSTVITDCSGGGDWGDEVAGRMEYFFNGLEQGVGQGWDCR